MINVIYARKVTVAERTLRLYFCGRKAALWEDYKKDFFAGFA
jgi:hypothetical protein